MTTIEEHKKIVRELEEDISEKIRKGIIVKRQKIIGFATSEATINLFALFLHKFHLIPPGFNVNHNFFVSLKRADEHFKFDFSDKKEILSLLVKQESLRGKLCYGREKKSYEVKKAVENFFKLKHLIKEQIKEEI